MQPIHQGVEEKRALVNWKDAFLDDLCDEYDFKKQVRPLLDFIGSTDRSLKK